MRRWVFVFALAVHSIGWCGTATFAPPYLDIAPFDPAQLSSDECLDRLVEAAQVVVRTELPFPHSVRIAGRDEVLSYYLGRSASANFVTREGKRQIKFFRGRSEGLVNYEIAATYFLRRRGYPVVSILSGPHRLQPCPSFLVTDVDAEYYGRETHCWALIKTYRHGMTTNEVRDLCYQRFGHDPRRLDSCLAAAFQPLLELKDVLVAPFLDGTFREFWDAYRIRMPSYREWWIDPKWIDQSDIKPSDFLLGEDGWTLLDP